MRRDRVSSSSIAAIGYDDHARILEIEFHGGSLYRYLDVPPDIHRRLLAARSHGAAFNALVRDAYRYRRLR
jgi:hypothetical protein